jgi:hypothetical protein
LPGPFDVEDAHRARAGLIPEDLLDREPLDVQRAAVWLPFPSASWRRPETWGVATARPHRRRAEDHLGAPTGPELTTTIIDLLSASG